MHSHRRPAGGISDKQLRQHPPFSPLSFSRHPSLRVVNMRVEQPPSHGKRSNMANVGTSMSVVFEHVDFAGVYVAEPE